MRIKTIFMCTVISSTVLVESLAPARILPRKPKLPRRQLARNLAMTLNSGETGDEYDLVVVGAGVGGLAAAARVANTGKRVLVLEAQEDEAVGAGGRCGSFVLSSACGDQYRFDSGPSLLLLPDVYEKSFLEAGGAKEWASLDIKPVEGPRYHIYFDDGVRGDSDGSGGGGGGGGGGSSTTTTGSNSASRQGSGRQTSGGMVPLVLRGGLEGFASDCDAFEALELVESGESGGGAAYAAHMVQSQRILDGGLPNFIEERLRLPALAQMLAEVLFGGAWPLDPQEKGLRKKFKSPKARAALSFQSLYVGLTPYDAPAVFNLLQPLELGPVPDPRRAESEPPAQGVFYPTGGFGTVSAALLQLCRSRGVEVEFGQRAETVHVENQRVVGLTVEGANEAKAAGGARAVGGAVGAVGSQRRRRVVKAKKVLVNADLAVAEEALLRGGGAGLFERSEEEEAEVLFSEVQGVRDFSDKQLSCSVVAFHWALDLELKGLAHHSLFLAVDEGGGGGWDDEKARPLDEPRRRAAWDWEESAAARGMLRTSPGGSAGEEGENPFLERRLGGADSRGCVNFYVHAPSRTDPSATSQPGHDAITVLVPVATTSQRKGGKKRSAVPSPLRNRQQQQEEQEEQKRATQAEEIEAAEEAAEEARLVANARRLVLGAFNRAWPDLGGSDSGAVGGGGGVEAHIVAERVVAPTDWRDTQELRGGAVFGLATPLSQLSLFRPGPRHPSVKGLFFCGASARPGNGVPLVLIGAKQVSEVILGDE